MSASVVYKDASNLHAKSTIDNDSYYDNNISSFRPYCKTKNRSRHGACGHFLQLPHRAPVNEVGGPSRPHPTSTSGGNRNEFSVLGKLIAAILTVSVVIAYCSTTDGAQKAIRGFLQTCVVRLIQVGLLCQGAYVVLLFFQTAGLPSRSEIGYLLLAIFNALIWGFFLSRDTLRYFLKDRRWQRPAA